MASSLLGFTGENVATFQVAIQSGAMCAVIWEYRVRLFGVLFDIASEPAARRFAWNVIVAFIPAVVLGMLFGTEIKALLFHPTPVALAFVVGALIILWVERRHHRAYGELDLEGVRHARVESIDDMTWVDALKVGLVQCAAMIPGTSRSGATIIGGMLFGLSRKAATEFSFYLAIPTLMGAGGYSLWKARDALAMTDVPVFTVGTVFAFVSALLCIRWLIRYISTHDFTVFAWYRIAFGGVILVTSWLGWVSWEG